MDEASGLPILPGPLSRQWLDFQRSGAPVKIVLIFRDRGMTYGVGPSNPQTIAAKKPIMKWVLPCGTTLLLDFVHMVCIEFGAGGYAKRTLSFYWVDDEGSFFSPVGFGGSEASVRKAFDRSSGGYLSVTAVRRCRHREARACGFLKKPTWAFGWYGAEPGDLDAAAGGGEVRTNLQLLDLAGARAGRPWAHGRGLHVSAVDRLQPGAVLSLLAMKLGTKGFSRFARVLYCALAPGVRELVAAGSPQSQPSCSFFHSGTDSLSRTRWYVFWDRSLGTSILPLYDVSFEVTEEGMKFMQRLNDKRKRQRWSKGVPCRRRG
ncbi:unnamed protein product [Urochloa decumbens]|uniref:Uncharacterized protein n=1 Tax=Urochloa decumbens TaxID=240449 RepID=A0ABC8ZMQ5_9POAL